MHLSSWRAFVFAALLGWAVGTAEPSNAAAQTQQPKDAAKAADLELSRLAAQAADSENWVTLITSTGGLSFHMTLNCIYSLRNYGGIETVLVAALDADAVERCAQMRQTDATGVLCLDYTPKLPSGQRKRVVPGQNATAISLGAPGYGPIGWSRVPITMALLNLGYHVRYTDTDVVFVRRAAPSYNWLLDWTGADVAFMAEQDPYADGTYLNGGVYAARSNARSRALFGAWSTGSALPRNQFYLSALRDVSWKLCFSRWECADAAARGYAAIVSHPSQFAPAHICPKPGAGRTLCAPRFLFVHAVCAGGHQKAASMRMNELLLVDERGAPLHAGGEHPFLPCRHQVAWQNVALWAEHITYSQAFQRSKLSGLAWPPHTLLMLNTSEREVPRARGRGSSSRRALLRAHGA